MFYVSFGWKVLEKALREMKEKKRKTSGQKPEDPNEERNASKRKSQNGHFVSGCESYLSDDDVEGRFPMT